MKKLVLFVLIAAVSCKDSDSEIAYFPSGNVKSILYYDDRKEKDSAIFYNDKSELVAYIDFYQDIGKVYRKEYGSNGFIEKEGFVNKDELPVGHWKFYDKEGNLQSIKELKIIEAKPYLNQEWFFKSNGDPATGGSSVKVEYSNDTIEIGNPIKAIATLEKPLFKDKDSEIMVLIPKDYSINFNEDFSNIKDVDLDTVHNLHVESLRDNVVYDVENPKWIVGYGRYFLDGGKNKFRSIIIEFYENKGPIKDSLNYFENWKYFEKEVFVKDSIK